ncbi:cell division protein CrgA [Jatrophihabitans sp. YIM 134969]
MPKSKVRKKPATAAARGGVSRTPVVVERQGPSPKWYPITMAVVLLLGLAYIVVYYIAGGDVPYMQDLGGWNLAIGFGVLVLGLLMSVRWR